MTNYITKTTNKNCGKKRKNKAIRHIDARAIATVILTRVWQEMDMIEKEFAKMDENNEQRDFNKAIDNLEKEYSSTFDTITKICHNLPLYTKYFI